MDMQHTTTCINFVFIFGDMILGYITCRVKLKVRGLFIKGKEYKDLRQFIIKKFS
jgi:hypothetical protein